MKYEVPEPKSFRYDHPTNKISRINQAFEGTPGGPEPVVPRPVMQPGNISMYDYLQLLKSQAEQENTQEITWE